VKKSHDHLRVVAVARSLSLAAMPTLRDVIDLRLGSEGEEMLMTISRAVAAASSSHAGILRPGGPCAQSARRTLSARIASATCAVFVALPRARAGLPAAVTNQDCERIVDAVRP
jgi:hypothetical protein